MRRERTVLTEEFSQSSKALAQSRIDASEARDGLARMRGLLEDQQQENTELVARVTTQSTELVALRDTATEMRSKLNMSELLQQQVQCVCVCVYWVMASLIEQPFVNEAVVAPHQLLTAVHLQQRIAKQ